MTDGPTITALASWFGGNRILAPAVGEELTGCRWVGVPFAGGMSELVHIDAPTIFVNDLHRAVINLARVTADLALGPRFYRRLRRLPFHEEVLRGAQERCRDWEASAFVSETPCLAWAVDYFVASWMGRSGKGGTVNEFNGKLGKRWTSTGGGSAVRYWSAVRSLSAWHRILRRCEFTIMDAFDFLARCQDCQAYGIYCDPPFHGPGDKYKHTFTLEQHKQLRDALQRFAAARVVVRYYDVPLVRQLYPEDRWTWRRLVGRKQTNADAPEVLILNGQSFATPSKPQSLFD